MATIVTRSGKGNPLTATEHDANLNNLNNDKAESGANSDITSLSGLTTPLSVAQGGTASATASAARTALGLAIGTDVQAYDAQLADVAGLTPTDSNFIVGDGANFVTESGATARTSLGLGTAAVLNTGTSDGDVVVLDATGLPAVDGSQLTGIADSTPAGVLSPYAGSSAPSGWLLCYGQAVSRTTYSALFAVVSTTYGVGDGSTTFNLPDLRGRVPLGLDNLGGASANTVTNAAADSLGGTEGAETHTLLEAEMPSHTHSYTISPDRVDNGTSSGTTDYWINDTGVSTGSAGSDSPHNNMQPYIALSYIIKT